MKSNVLSIGDLCTGCGACAESCSKGCIKIAPNVEGFYYPSIDESSCIDCGLCVHTCPVISLQDNPPAEMSEFFAYHTLDEKIRENSTSGGAFSLFAEYVLGRGGIVFGSAYNGDHGRLEVRNSEDCDISFLRKSKYIESYAYGSFSSVRAKLENKKTVLFCGTPCEVRGLVSYLRVHRVDTTNLITMDFACHGVPSNKSFSDFVHCIGVRRRKILSTDFRYKDFSKPRQGWHDMLLKVVYADGKIKLYPYYGLYYLYYRPVMDNVMLRKSCYDCNRSIHSVADVTVGDFWGVKQYNPAWDDNKGISFIKINSKKVLPIWYEISNHGFMEKIPASSMAYLFKDRCRQWQIPNRNKFMNEYAEKGFFRAVVHQYGIGNILKNTMAIPLKFIIHDS